MIRYTFTGGEYSTLRLLLEVYHHLEILQKAQGEKKDWFGDDLANLFAVITDLADRAKETVREVK